MFIMVDYVRGMTEGVLYGKNRSLEDLILLNVVLGRLPLCANVDTPMMMG